MNYLRLAEDSPDKFRRPLILRMPGAGLAGKTVFYNGALLTLGAELKALTAEKILLVAGKHVLQGDEGPVICNILSEAGMDYDIFSEVPPEPHLDTAGQISALMDNRRYGAVVGIGGGSVMDMAKLASHGGDGQLMERIRNGRFSGRKRPLILLPTTAGTGSEISPYVVLTVDGKKRFYSSPEFLPTIAMIDPLLTIAMPGRITASTAFDAMTHALEGCMACPSPYAECLAAESTALIFTYLSGAIDDGENIEARYYLSLASVMGMMSYCMGGGLYAHSISYILTTEKNQPHGLGCGLALPYTMAFNEPYIEMLLSRLSVRCFGKQGTKESRREVIEKIQQLFIQSGLPRSLAELGYGKNDVPNLAGTLLRDYGRAGNPRQMSEENARNLFEAMITGEIKYF